MAKKGRKPEYQKKVGKHLSLIKQWLHDGYTEYQIRDALGLNRTTWNKYKKKYPSLRNALEEMKGVLGMELELMAMDKLKNNPDTSKNNGLLWNMLKTRNDKYREEENKGIELQPLKIEIISASKTDDELEKTVSDVKEKLKDQGKIT
jgi:hypothetical protein